MPLAIGESIVDHDEGAAARPQHAKALVNAAQRIAGMMVDPDGYDAIHPFVGVRTRQHAPLPGRRCKANHPQPRVHHVDWPLRNVEAVIVRARLGDPLAEGAVAEADFKDVFAGHF